MPALIYCGLKFFTGQQYFEIRFLTKNIVSFKSFRLHSYIFRRTAISLAINNGLPIAYVSSLSDTQAENIQKYYYNGHNKLNIERLKEIFDEIKS